MSSPVASQTAIRRFVPPPPPKTPKSAGTRLRLLDVAARLFIERGYAAVSMRDIASAAEAHQGRGLRTFPLEGPAPRRGDPLEARRARPRAGLQRSDGRLRARRRPDLRRGRTRDPSARSRCRGRARATIPTSPPGLRTLYRRAARPDTRRRWQMCATPTPRRGSSRVLTAGIGTKESAGLPLPDADRLHATLVAVLRATWDEFDGNGGHDDHGRHPSRFVNDAVSLDPATFVDEHVPALPEGARCRCRARCRSARAGAAHPRRRRRAAHVLRRRASDSSCERGADDALVVALDRAAFSDLVQDVASTFGLQMAGRAKVERGSARRVPRVGAGAAVLPRRPRRSTSRASIAFVDRAGAPARPAPVVHARRRPGGGRPLPRRGRVTCTSRASSPRRRWPRCRPSSTTRSPPPSATTARRGGRARVTASGTRRGSSASTSKSPTLRELLRSDRFATDRHVHRRPLRAARSRRRRLGRGSAQEDRRRRGHLRRELAQGLLDGRAQPRVLRAHRRDLGDRRRARERRARRRRRLAPRQRSRRSASTASTCRACRSPPAPATSPCTARARCT